MVSVGVDERLPRTEKVVVSEDIRTGDEALGAVFCER
jgi:hypothetical protein